MSQANEIPIHVNGQESLVPMGLTLSALLQHLKIDGSRVAVELNRRIIRKPEWPATPVESGAQIEIVEFVGGG